MRVGFGTWGLGGRAYGEVPEDQAAEALEEALRLGVRFFDTADIYGDGRAEALLGRYVSQEGDAEILTKAGYLAEAGGAQDFSDRHLRSALDASLRRLRRERVDVFLLHSPPRGVLVDGGALAALDRIRGEGLAERTGVSLRTVDDFEAVVSSPACQVIELIFNLLDQRAAERAMLTRASDRGIEVIVRVPLCFGLLSGRYSLGHTFAEGDQRRRWSRRQLDAWIAAAGEFAFLARNHRTPTQAAIAFCLATPGVGRVIPGMKSVVQVRESVGASDVERALRPEEFTAARATWPSLRHIPPS